MVDGVSVYGVKAYKIRMIYYSSRMCFENGGHIAAIKFEGKKTKRKAKKM